MYNFDDVTSMNDTLFQQFSESFVENEDYRHNYCPDCKFPMELSGIEYHCRYCGLTQTNEMDGCGDHEETVSSSIRITTGANSGRFYNTANDYTKTQKKIILDQLLQRQSSYNGPAFQVNILNAAATQYNCIQKFIKEDDLDENGYIQGQKKFVRRGNIKDEVLAGLIYFEGIREKIVWKKKDIAMFMGLVTGGFARGEDILRTFEAEGKIDIPVDEEPIEGFVDRYLEALNLDNVNYGKFITEIVEESEKRKIGMNSQLSSKIVGALWIIINKCHLNITAHQLEKAADNTKKNTFTKFYNVVFNNMGVFTHIFSKYGIPK